MTNQIEQLVKQYPNLYLTNLDNSIQIIGSYNGIDPEPERSEIIGSLFSIKNQLNNHNDNGIQSVSNIQHGQDRKYIEIILK